MAWNEIIMSSDVFSSKVLEDVGLLMTPTSFKRRNMKKINIILRSLIKCYLKIIEMLTMYTS